MRSTLLLALLLIPSLASAVTLDPYRVPEAMDLAAASRRTHAVLADPGSAANIFLLTDRTERLDRSLGETSTAIENIGQLIKFLSGTKDGPKQVTSHLIDFLADLDRSKDALVALNADAHSALVAAQPATGAQFAAQSLKQHALTLRSHLEALRAFSQVLAQNIHDHRANLGEAAAAAAREIADKRVLALTVLSDDLVLTADLLVRKAQ